MWTSWQHGSTAEVSPLLRRRVSFTAGLIVASAIAWVLNLVLQISLRESAFYSGLLLLVLVLGLTFLNARKKLAFLPLIRASTWLQIHIYAGYFCFFVFLLHIHFSPPRGALEISLAAVFCVVIFSGFFGIFFSRVFPSPLALPGVRLISHTHPT